MTTHPRKALRELTILAQQRELEQALSELEAKFQAWRAGKLSPYELNDAVHAYHDGVARDIWKRYADSKPEQIIPLLVAKGLLQESELDARQIEEFGPTIANLRQESGPP